MHDLSGSLPQKPKWDDAYTRPSVEAEEVHELLHFCTAELKARGTSHMGAALRFDPGGGMNTNRNAPV